MANANVTGHSNKTCLVSALLVNPLYNNGAINTKVIKNDIRVRETVRPKSDQHINLTDAKIGNNEMTKPDGPNLFSARLNSIRFTGR